MSKRSRRRDPAVENTVAEFPSREEIADLQILCEDTPIIAVSKPAGLLSQGAPRGVFCLPDYVKAYLKYQYDKPGNVYLGVIHRIDRPATGVVLFSRNSKGAARLSEQFRERQVKKTYLVLLESPPPEEEGKLVDLIRKIPDQARAVIEPSESNGARRAELSYRVLGTHQEYTLVEVTPLTGRMHQIRLQFASRGCPILGDQLYGANHEIDLRPLTSDYTTQIALHAWKLEFQHPVRYDTQVITAPLPPEWPNFAGQFLP